jgi:hypothetical protein
LEDGEPVCALYQERQYIDISNEDRYGKIALDLLTHRMNGEFGGPIQEPTPPAPFPMTAEEFAALDRESKEYRAIQNQYAEAIKQHQIYDQELRMYKAVCRCIAEGDTRLAPALLEERRELPGEGYEIAYLYDGIRTRIRP